MRLTRVVLIVDFAWLAAAAAAAALLRLEGWPGLVLAGLSMATALAGSIAFALASQQQAQHKLAELGKAVGAGKDLNDAVSIEAIVGNLVGRLERANQFKSLVASLSRPVVVVSAEGEILGASRGLAELEPRAVEGTSIEVLLGPGWANGGMAEEELIVLNEMRYTAQHRPGGNGRTIIELQPAGAFIADDDLDAFATALAGGHTNFRFDAKSRARSPVLRHLGDGLEALDLGVVALDRLLAGEPLSSQMRRSNTGIAPKVRELADLVGALADTRDEHAEARAALERKCEAILGAIDRYREALRTMSDSAGAAQAGATDAQTALRRGRDKLADLQALSQNARTILGQAGQSAERVGTAAASVAGNSSEIDKLVAAIEDVSFRTNLLALNAAVEAARAGEKGAGFAVVAEEVRMLAQTTQRTSREIRTLVGANRAQSQNGAGESEALRNILSGLGRHLENLSSDTDMISAAFGDGSGAIGRLDTQLSVLEVAATGALALPGRRQQGASGR